MPARSAPPLQRSAGVPHTTPPRAPLLSGAVADRIFAWLTRGAAMLTLALLIGILVSLVIGAWPSIEKYGVTFLARSVWD
ncbi:phosphate ABC transporter permease PstC, partial [Rhizobium leguminosarum]|nr:phosphate ABC transporter permease PstC [Rhizobium leguminosarum]